MADLPRMVAAAPVAATPADAAAALDAFLATASGLDDALRLRLADLARAVRGLPPLTPPDDAGHDDGATA